MDKESEFGAMSSYSDEDISSDMSVLKRLLRKVENGKHSILYGPPGTGKTRLVQLLKDELGSRLGTVNFVQFHPQFSYQEFIEGYAVKNGVFDYKEGVFLKFLKKLSKVPAKKINLFVIDEINRADISSVFGELLTLLDDSGDKNVVLPTSGKELHITSKFVIVGTMNSADKNIAIMDFALRRRFDFLFMGPDYAGMNDWLLSLNWKVTEFDVDAYVLFARKLNHRIATNPILGKNMTLGQALFVPPKLSKERVDLEDLFEMIADKVIPQIESYLGTGNQKDLANLLSPEIREKVTMGEPLGPADLVNLVNSIVPSNE